MNVYKGSTRPLASRETLLFLFAFIFVFLSFGKAAESFSGSEGALQPTTAYTITSYHVDINVDSQNVLTIKENFNVNFAVPRQGIIRAIPTTNKVVFENENGKQQSLNYKTKITNVKTNTNAQLSSEANFAFIRLGTSGVNVIGNKNYIIEYKVHIGDDRILAFDQFYYNVIGHDWDTSISNISFSVQLPKQVEQGKQMHIYAGAYGENSQQTVAVENDRTTFLYTYSGTLQPFQGLTARVVLPQSYFEVQKSMVFDYVLLGMLIAVALFVLFKGLKQKKQIVTPVVMFKPPQALPPSELGYIIDGVVDNKDIAALVVYWAQEGFLKIVEGQNQGDYSLVKLSQMPDSKNQYETSIFNKIFAQKDAVNLKDVGRLIWQEVAKAKIKIENKHFSNQFIKANKSLKNFLVFLSAVVITAVTARITRLEVEPLKQFLVGLLGLVSLGGMFAFLHKQQTKFKRAEGKNNFVVPFLLMLAIWFAMAALSFTQYSDSLFLSFVAIATAASLFFYSAKVPIRNPKGLDLLGEVVGFKQFISLTEKDRIKLLAEKDPQMFYNVLPYAYVLGVSEEWIKKFEGVAIAQPSWLETNRSFTIFDYMIMRSILNTMLPSISKGFNYTPTNNSKGFGGGFGSGGGFSGGGFGGGGGRSW